MTSSDTLETLSRRRKVVLIPPTMLGRMLSQETNWRCMVGVPDDAVYVGTHVDPALDAVAVCFAHPSFDLVPEGSTIPMITAIVERLADGDGQGGG